MPIVLAAGVLTCVAVFAALDALVRLRLRDAGEKAVFLRGGALDYSKYLRLRRQYRWSGWPVYLLPVFLLIGLGLLAFGLLQSN